MSNLAEMVPELLQKTRVGRLHWEEPDYNELEARISSYKLFMRLAREGLSLTLFDAEGRPLDEVHSLESSRASHFAVRTADLQPLFEEAKRRARRVDEAMAEVESLLKAL